MFDDLLSANIEYAEGFSLQGIPPVAARGFGLVTCMDSRIEPLTMLGLHPGDAKILRNAGARVTPDVVRSLILATRFLDVREVAVMQHTKCALAHETDAGVRSRLVGSGATGVDDVEFLAMPDPDDALVADVDLLRNCAQLSAGTRIEGWRYDVDTGRIDRIVPS
jgi:carbonic anhydrase